ncbi:MAG: hypothetical protein ACFB22_15400 [Rhodothalassiaceae bacterium]
MRINWVFVLKSLGVYLALSGVVVFAVVLRDAVFLPAVGPMAAHWMGAALALLLIFGMTALLLRMVQEPRRPGDLWVTGGLWAALTLALELYVYGVLFDAPAAEITRSYAVLRGQTWPLILLGLLLAPPLMGRQRPA